jgi:hypothetical protein
MIAIGIIIIILLVLINENISKISKPTIDKPTIDKNGENTTN